jgi:hypothetical protein
VKLPKPSDPAEPHRRTRIASPDFFRSPANVDWVSPCAILQFLLCTASASIGQASRANQLSHLAVSRPEHSSSMNSPACARGPAESNHLQRRLVPRRDRRNLPDLTRAISPPVSPSTLTSAAGTVPIGKGPRVRFRVTSGGFLRCERLSAIGTRGPVSKETRKKIPGTLEQSRFSFSFRI